MEDSFQWTTNIPNRLGPLMRAIEELDRRLDQSGADSNARYLAQLAVEELGTNIIKYGYDDPDEHLILLSAVCDERFVRICLEDDGHEFNPWQRPEPDPNLSLQERTPGGWGISLLRKLLAGTNYERRDNKNVVCVVVPLKSPLTDS